MLFFFDIILLVIYMEATIAHELNNALTICEGYLKMNNLKYNEIILEELKRSKDILNNVMSSSFYFKFECLIKEVKVFFDIYKKDKKVIFNYHNNEYQLFANYNGMKQVFINIVKNSIESIPCTGYIDIDIKQENSNYVIEICDNGEGIPKDTIDAINNDCIISNHGHGIGIKVIKDIIKNHNGKIEYISKLHYGTLVRIVLPIN